MAKGKGRATGTAVGAVCGFLTGTFALSVGLLQVLVSLDFVAGSTIAVASYFVGGFVVAVSTGVFTMRSSARKLAVPVTSAPSPRSGCCTPGTPATSRPHSSP